MSDLGHQATPPGSLIATRELRQAARSAVTEGWSVTRPSPESVLALLDVLEAARDLLAIEYPVGTDHPVDAEANRLARYVARFSS